MELKVKVKTRSNYRGLNGAWLTVHEIVGTRVTCKADGDPTLMDFAVKEVCEWSMPAKPELK